MNWNRDEAKRTVDKTLSHSTGGDCEVSLEAGLSSHTRFARNEITTSGFTEELSLTITSRKDGRSGRITTDDLSTEGLKTAVARAEELRALMPVDPESVDSLPKQDYPALEKYDEASARARAADRAAGVKATLALARKKKLLTAGFFENTLAHRAIGNSKGNFGYYLSSGVEFSTTMRTQDGTGSGWAAGYSPRLSAIDPKEIAGRAAEKGTRSASPREVAPGDYTVILEPAAVANLLQGLQFGMMSARAADEGRSVFSKQGGGNRIGDKMFHESVTVRTDPFDPRVPALPWSGGGFFGGDSGGLPNRKVTWIEKGILKTLFTDRYWARTTKTDPTPFPSSVVMEGGSSTLEDLIASTGKGLLVTRFWYIRTVNPQTAQLTGLTRDGLFLIEKGRIAGPVVNLRFNESPVVMLQNVEGMTAAAPAGRMVLPAIKSREFTFTSKSDAV
jgi:predicted Zn-dependent protease